MTATLEQRVAIVTGSGRGIGRGIALRLAREGARVLVADNGSLVDGSGSRSDIADQVVNEIAETGGEAVANSGSVAVRADAEGMIAQALDQWGRLDILVNAAGNYRLNSILDCTDEDWASIMSVHAGGTFHTSQAAARHWVANGGPGRIVNFTSLAGTAGMPWIFAYSTAKAAIIGLTRSCANALHSYGVTANCISPLGGTRMVDRSATPDVLEQAQKTGEWPSATLGRDPREIAPLVAYLVSDAAANVSGRIFGATIGRYSLYNEPEEIRVLFSDGPWDVDRLHADFAETLGEGLSLDQLSWPAESAEGFVREEDFPHQLLG